MAFHCIIVEKSKVEKSCHGSDYDLAMRKHFGKSIETKIGNSSRLTQTDNARESNH
ncbi:hypothetical protein KAM546c_14010 [Enterobacter roggenkampii]|nr:hypothetical protein KAM546c_14010 [Enterobacter roggenkampii]